MLNKEIQILNEVVFFSEKSSTNIANNIEVFSENQANKYEQRTNNGSLLNKDKTTQDIAVGKWGEFFASRWIGINFGIWLMPDIKIYDNQHKSWDHDLPYKNKGYNLENVAVKTCTKFTKDNYGESWTFQYGYPKDDLFNDMNQSTIVMCVYIEQLPKAGALASAIIVASVPWNKVKLDNADIGEVILREPSINRLKGGKKCLYYKDIEEAVIK